MNPFIFLCIHFWLRWDPDTRSVDTQGKSMVLFSVEGPSLYTLLATCAQPGGLFLPPSPQQSQQVSMQAEFPSFHLCTFHCISHNALHHHQHPLLLGGLERLPLMSTWLPENIGPCSRGALALPDLDMRSSYWYMDLFSPPLPLPSILPSSCVSLHRHFNMKTGAAALWIW